MFERLVFYYVLLNYQNQSATMKTGIRVLDGRQLVSAYFYLIKSTGDYLSISLGNPKNRIGIHKAM